MSKAERERALHMYRAGFDAGHRSGRESERRHWLATAPAEVLLQRVIGVLAEALAEADRERRGRC